MIEERVTPGISPYEVMQEHIDRYAFATSCTQGKRVLDAACGSGYGSHMLAEYAESVTGIDISSEAITYAKEHYSGENIQYFKEDVTALPFDDDSFDVVTSFETLEHVVDYEKLLREFKRVLKPGGTLIISTPNVYISSPGGDIKNPYHVFEFTPHVFKQLLEGHFKEVEIHGQRNINLIKKYTIDTYCYLKRIVGIERALFKEPAVNQTCSFPVEKFSIGMTTSAYMVAVCRK